MQIPPTSLNGFLPKVRGPLLVGLLAWGAAFGSAAANTAHADPVMGNQIMPSSLQANALHNASEGATESATTSEFTQLLQDLSPLPVLALGLLGLIWIRRHSAQL